MAPLSKSARRALLLFVGVTVVDVLSIGAWILASRGGGRSTWYTFAFLGLAIVTLIALTLGARWVRAPRPVKVVSEETWKQQTAARHWVVWRKGVWGFGLAMAVGMVIFNSWTVLPDHRLAALLTWRSAIRVGLVVLTSIPLGLLAGYLWGRVMWAWFAPSVRGPR